MTRPQVHPTSDVVYAELGSGATAGDRQAGWPLLRFVDALVTGGVAVVDDAVRGAHGWARMLDPDDAPGYALAWIASFAGVRLPVGVDEGEARELLRDAPGQARGTLASIDAVVRQRLTGTRTVKIRERDGSAYRLRITTFTSETPDPGDVEDAAVAATPAGIVVVYATVDGASYATLTQRFGTYVELGTLAPRPVTYAGVGDLADTYGGLSEQAAVYDDLTTLEVTFPPGEFEDYEAMRTYIPEEL